mgnify:CR=1 FL=1
MAKNDSTLRTILVVAAAAAVLALIITRIDPPSLPGSNAASVNAPKAALASSPWAASAPGRVEPKGGEVRLVPQATGTIEHVLAKVNDRVEAGDPLVKLDSADVIVRLVAAEAEENIRVDERNSEPSNNALVKARQAADDALFAAERSVYAAKRALDSLFIQAPRPENFNEELGKRREAITAARSALIEARKNARAAQNASKIPNYSRLEASLSTARSDLLLLEIALDRLTLRAPKNGTILQSHARVGELSAPSTQHVLMVIGDTSALRVLAEFEERDISKIRVGQEAVVRSDAFPGKDFSGKIAEIGNSLGLSRIGARGPRRPTDVDVLEVKIDIENAAGLLSGMRVDVFLKP